MDEICKGYLPPTEFEIESQFTDCMFCHRCLIGMFSKLPDVMDQRFVGYIHLKI